MNNKEIIAAADKCLTPNYARRPIALVRGKKASVWDADGKKYLDFFSGLAVANLGHGYLPVNKAVQKQMGKLTHVSNVFYTEPQLELAQNLSAHMPQKGRFFFCNSGAEANEAALKLARLTAKEDKKRTEIIAFDNSFHGRTMGALSMTGQKKYHAGVGPMLSGIKFVPFGDLAALEKAIGPKTAAVIVETIQGEGGVIVPKAGFLNGISSLCRKNGALLIVDEVQTGFSRTGKLFSYEHFKMKPDIVTMAKGIANGLPMGAMWAREEIAKHLVPGTHASTFGGNPVVAAGAIEALKALTEEEPLDHVRGLGRYMLLKLNGYKTSAPFIKEVRGLGLMIGVELGGPCANVVNECAQKGLLLNCAGEKVIRLLPPLNVTRDEVDKALAILGKVLGVS